MVGLEFWVRFRLPIYANETIRLEWLVIKVTASEKLGGDIVELRGRIRAQDGRTAVGAKGRVWSPIGCRIAEGVLPEAQTLINALRFRIAVSPMNSKNHEAGLKAARTKGREERSRAALMANWTRKHGKDDAKNPYSRENYRNGSVVRDAPHSAGNMKSYTAVVELSSETGLYVGFVPGFPGAHSQGETLDELNANLREVIAMLLEDGEPIVESEFVGTQLVRVG